MLLQFPQKKKTGAWIEKKIKWGKEENKLQDILKEAKGMETTKGIALLVEYAEKSKAKGKWKGRVEGVDRAEAMELHIRNLEDAKQFGEIGTTRGTETSVVTIVSNKDVIVNDLDCRCSC